MAGEDANILSQIYQFEAIAAFTWSRCICSVGNFAAANACTISLSLQS